ncbi:MAG: M48 family metalloprotease [Isosphaeraceae bacterium]
MPRPLIFAAAGLAYTVLACALVSHMGRTHRESLRVQRERDAPSPASTVGELVKSTPNDPPVPTPPPSPVVIEPAPVASPTEPEPKVVASTKKVVPKREPTPASPPEPPKPPPLPPPEPHWADELDLTRLSAADEMRLGADLHARLTAVVPIDDQGDLQRIGRAARKLLDAREREDVDYKFFVLKSDEVFCASLPGGFIYVSQGFFLFAGEDVAPEDDYVLEFALAHEIAHVDMRHALKVAQAGRAATREKRVDTLSGLLVPLLFAYPDDEEYAADAWAYHQLTVRLDRTRRQSSMFLTRLEGFADSAGFKNGRKPMAGLILAENHYRAHPAPYERRDRIRALAGPVGVARP